jgi:hypothetical protein
MGYWVYGKGKDNIDNIDMTADEVIEMMKLDIHPLQDRMTARWVPDKGNYKWFVPKDMDDTVPHYCLDRKGQWRQWKALWEQAFEEGHYGLWFDYMCVWSLRSSMSGLWGTFIKGEFSDGGTAVGIINRPPQPAHWDGVAFNTLGVEWYFTKDELVSQLRIASTDDMENSGGSCRQGEFFRPQTKMLMPSQALQLITEIEEERRKEDIKGV